MTTIFDPDLISKYDCHGPRYTSYPTALEFDESYTPENYLADINNSNNALLPRSLSIYLHIPFCHSLCYFCGCNKIVCAPSNSEKIETYLDYLYREIELKADLFDSDRLVKQIHFGGGTPNYLTIEQFREIVEVIAKSFHLDLPGQIELSTELDPRHIQPSQLLELSELGFNRFSIGVQDFDIKVQQAVNRVQSESQVISLIEAAKSSCNSVSVDLIVGLPNQTTESFLNTLSTVIEQGVSRLAIYNFAYMPQRIKAQKLINKSELPSTEARIEIMHKASELLHESGYLHIGMDHFALPDDDLSIAYGDSSLQRNFQGYTTHSNTDLIGLGVSAISQFSSGYAQNHPNLSSYYASLDRTELPINKGITITQDDQIRGDLIQQIMCRKKIDFSDFEVKHKVSFSDYFADELDSLTPFIDDELVVIDHDSLTVTESGRYFLRNICMAFDAYLDQYQTTNNKTKVVRFSRTL